MKETKSDPNAKPETKQAAKAEPKMTLQTKFNEEEYNRWSQNLQNRGKSK